MDDFVREERPVGGNNSARGLARVGRAEAAEMLYRSWRRPLGLRTDRYDSGREAGNAHTHVTRDAFPIAHARRIVDAMSRAKIIVGTLMLLCGLALVALRISIARQPNGDTYGIILGGVEHIAFGLLLALVGGLVLATARRGQ
jgi:hypothetical protein